MKIAVSLSSEGFGHASRAVVIAEEIRNKAEIVFFSDNNIREYMQKHLGSINFYRINGLKLKKKGHSISYIETFIEALNSISDLYTETERLENILLKEKIDLVLTDYEPFLPRAARRLDIPVVQISHQLVLNRHRSLSLPSIAASIAGEIMIPVCDEQLAVSFYDGDIGPLVRRKIRYARPQRGERLLVYAKAGIKPGILEFLRKHPEIKADVFPDESKDFDEALVNARAVIAPAGHQLISECLHLKKPMLVFAEEAQYEQMLNAEMLAKSGCGVSGRIATLEHDITAFLANLDDYPWQRGLPSDRFCLEDDTATLLTELDKICERQLLYTGPGFSDILYH